MSLFKPDAPTPPNPIATAGAQTSSNVMTGISNAWMNNINQQGPYGSLQYSQSDTRPYTDPTTGATYNIPVFTATQQLSPFGRQLLDVNNGTQLNTAQAGQF